MVLYIDETGWKVGKETCYTWAFSTAMHVLFRCGVGRGKAEAEAVIGTQFTGIGVTDDYGAYQSLLQNHTNFGVLRTLGDPPQSDEKQT